MKLDGEIALVTGGARGMGATHSRALIMEGAKVVIADILDSEGQALAAELGDGAIFSHLDVTDEASWAAAIAAAESAFGPVSILVNNAGIANGAPLEQFTLEMWNAIIAVNQTGVFLGIRAVAPGMKTLRHGSIINISSVEGLRGEAYLHGYVASKFAVRGLTKSVAQELGPHSSTRSSYRSRCIAAARRKRSRSSSCSWRATTRRIRPVRSSSSTAV